MVRAGYGGRIVLSPLPSETADGELYQSGTQQADQSVPFNLGAAFPGAGTILGGGFGIYPYPNLSPSLANVMLPRNHAVPGAPGGNTAGNATPPDLAAAGSNGTGGASTTGLLVSPAQLAAAQTGTSGGLVIDPIFDSSITGSTLAASIEAAVTAAIDCYEAAITTPITVGITFSYGAIAGETIAAGDVSESDGNGADFSYDVFAAALAAHDAAVPGATAVPSADPFAPDDAWWITNSEAAALGITQGTNVSGGAVGLSSQDSFYFGTSGTVPSGEYDAVGALEHEISEVMGRLAFYNPDKPLILLSPDGTALAGGFTVASEYSPLDLFRYIGAGTLANTGTAAWFSINNGTTSLDEFNNATQYGNDPGDWSSIANDVSPVADDAFDAFVSTGEPNPVSATDLTVLDMLGYSLAAACFAAGTRIRTAHGEVPVEQLAVGDRVHTRFAGVVPIPWIGQRRLDCRRHHAPDEVRPVRILAAAFAPGVPSRDLFLSPDHAVSIGGALIPIRLLANGGSIRQESDTAAVHYFHVELDRHDLLWAEGLEAESYLDTGNRAMFANAGIAPAPQSGIDPQRRRETQSCLPFLVEPGQVEQMWRRLATRSVQLGWPLPRVATTADPALAVAACDRRFGPVRLDSARYTFALPPLPGGARLQSRSAVPAALRPWREDRRLLGVMVQRLTVRLAHAVTDLALDDPRLDDGWWKPEHADGALWRWTDGDAVLPPLDGPGILTVALGETLPYPLAGPVSAGVAPPSAAAALLLPAGPRSLAGGPAPVPHSTRFW